MPTSHKMNFFKLIIDLILNAWIFFRGLFKERKQMEVSEGNKITVEAEIHHGRMNNGVLRRRAETEAGNKDRYQNIEEFLNADAIERA